MHRLVPTLVAEMGGAYPELRRAEPVIVETLRQEEERFRRTLGRGMALLDEATAGLGDGDVLSGETAFSSTTPMASRSTSPRTRSAPGHRRRHRRLRCGDGAPAHDGARELGRAPASRRRARSGSRLRERLGPTQFLGYEATEATGELIALVKDGVEVDAAEAGETVEALFDRTPFYAESGGQAGDRGEIEWPGGRAEVVDTHQGGRRPARPRAEDRRGPARGSAPARALAVDAERRARTRLNHSAAHLAHAALKHVLGPHVAQKGQLVDAERMRFDFSHGAPLTAAEIDAIETEVNAVIRQNLPALTEEMAPQAAIEAGAVALFGEKYGDAVRVLTLGRGARRRRAPIPWSSAAAPMWRAPATSRSSRSSPSRASPPAIRRIEALTGEPARRWLLDQAGVARQLADQFRVPVAEVPARVEALQAQARKAERELADAKRQLAVGGGSGGGGAAEIEDVAGVKFIGRVLEGVGGKDLRPIAETFRKQLPDGVIVLNGVLDGKVANTVVVTGSAQAKFSAVDLARIAVAAMGGQGAGGKPDFAQGGAPDGAKAADGVAAVRAALAA